MIRVGGHKYHILTGFRYLTKVGGAWNVMYVSTVVTKASELGGSLPTKLRKQ